MTFGTPCADSLLTLVKNSLKQGFKKTEAGLVQSLSMCLQVRQQEIELDIAFDVMEVAMQEEECKNKHVSGQDTCASGFPAWHAVLHACQRHA